MTVKLIPGYHMAKYSEIPFIWEGARSKFCKELIDHFYPWLWLDLTNKAASELKTLK